MTAVIEIHQVKAEMTEQKNEKTLYVIKENIYSKISHLERLEDPCWPLPMDAQPALLKAHLHKAL